MPTKQRSKSYPPKKRDQNHNYDKKRMPITLLGHWILAVFALLEPTLLQLLFIFYLFLWRIIISPYEVWHNARLVKEWFLQVWGPAIDPGPPHLLIPLPVFPDRFTPYSKNNNFTLRGFGYCGLSHFRMTIFSLFVNVACDAMLDDATRPFRRGGAHVDPKRSDGASCQSIAGPSVDPLGVIHWFVVSRRSLHLAAH